VISGVGGLGHMATQYARAIGLHVAAVDVATAVAVNARSTDPSAYLKQEIGGAHGVLVTAPLAEGVRAGSGYGPPRRDDRSEWPAPGLFPSADYQHGASVLSHK
jgi:hypothetical protein